MLDTLVNWVNEALKYAINFLPSTPFAMIANTPAATYLGYVNWFMPVSFFLASLEGWLTCIAIYYGVSAILRWTKAIS